MVNYLVLLSTNFYPLRSSTAIHLRHSEKPTKNSQIPDRIEPYFDLVKSWLDMEEKGRKAYDTLHRSLEPKENAALISVHIVNYCSKNPSCSFCLVFWSLRMTRILLAWAPLFDSCTCRTRPGAPNVLTEVNLPF